MGPLALLTMKPEAKAADPTLGGVMLLNKLIIPKMGPIEEAAQHFLRYCTAYTVAVGNNSG
jgi:hypothetical protein